MATILVAEDDLTARIMLGNFIEEMGHSAIFSPDGQHALESILVNPRISLLITDVSMPRMDGRALIRSLRKMDAYSELPIIVISGVVGPREIADLLKIGATRFLPKPIDQRVVMECINASLRKAGGYV
jgi:CheY-like chemotaxis protein